MKLNQESSKGAAILIVVIVAVILAVVLFKDLKKIFDNIIESLGLAPSKEQTQNKEYINDEVNRQNALGSKSAWSPVYYTVVSRDNGFAFSVEQAQKLCKQIWDSVGLVSDSPNLAAGAIKSCQNKRNVSFLADGMNDIYGVNLLSWLEQKFDTNEQREILAGILRYVNGLPAK
jgi:hypothetical protein